MSTDQPSTTASRTDTIRVLVVDDHPAIRNAVRGTIDDKNAMEVCGESSTSEDALRLMAEETPDVAIVDISLDDGHGLDLIQSVKSHHPDVASVVFSKYDENVYAERAIRAGALGYVMKGKPTQNIVDAVQRVHDGELYLSDSMASRLLNMVATSDSPEPASGLDELTDREMAVFQMLGQGYPIQEITDRLCLARKTIETYRRRAKEKLGFDTVSELLRYAVEWTYSQGAPPRSDHAPPEMSQH